MLCRRAAWCGWPAAEGDVTKGVRGGRRALSRARTARPEGGASITGEGAVTLEPRHSLRARVGARRRLM
jgi:hypothetical protein